MKLGDWDKYCAISGSTCVPVFQAVDQGFQTRGMIAAEREKSPTYWVNILSRRWGVHDVKISLCNSNCKFTKMTLITKHM